MYRMLRPFVMRLWAWQKHLNGNEPSWLFWEVNDWQPVFLLPATDKAICTVLLEEIFNN